jgi:hypothetical protein
MLFQWLCILVIEEIPSMLLTKTKVDIGLFLHLNASGCTVTVLPMHGCFKSCDQLGLVSDLSIQVKFFSVGIMRQR